MDYKLISSGWCSNGSVQHRGVPTEAMPALGCCWWCHCMEFVSLITLLFPLAAGDGVLRRGLRHWSHQEHQGEHLEGGVDCLHLQRDSAGTCPGGAECCWECGSWVLRGHRKPLAPQISWMLCCHGLEPLRCWQAWMIHVPVWCIINKPCLMPFSSVSCLNFNPLFPSTKILSPICIKRAKIYLR